MSEWREVEFGRIPSYWDISPINDLKSDVKNAVAMGPFGSNIKAENFVAHGVPVIRGTNFNYHKYIQGEFVYLTEEKADELKGSNCKAGDIVFTHRGTLGQVGIIPDWGYPRYVISQSGMKLTVNTDIVHPEYIVYFFLSKYGQYQILKYESQVGVPSISNPLASLKKIEVPYPPLPEQKAIAEVLSSLDDKIDLLHRQNKTLEQMAETLFRQWFVEEAQDDWEETTLGEVIDIFDSKRIPLSKIKRDNMKTGKLYPYYGAATIMDYVNDYIFDGEYILIAEDGTVRTPEGYPVLQYATGKFWVNNHTHIIKAKPPYNNFFIWNYLVRKNIDKIITGAVQPKINQTNLKSLEFPVIPKKLSQRYIKITNKQFTKINKNKAQIRTLESLRDTLLPKLMSGKIRVSFNN